MDASTFVVIFLVAVAAVLASYGLSQWGFFRGGNGGMGWLLTAVGTIFLLAAASMLVLTAGRLPMLVRWSNENDESAQKTREFAFFGHEWAERLFQQPAARSATSASAVAPEDRHTQSAAGRYVSRDDFERRNESEPVSIQDSPQPLAALAASRPVAGVGRAYVAGAPWGATECVHAFNFDPADLTRWRIENECGVPVGVLFAACPESSGQCRADAWHYPTDGIILPAKAQRPVFQEDDTRSGGAISYIACAVATPSAIELIGRSTEVRSSLSWKEAWDIARSKDDCLMLVRRWSDAGSSTGRSIEALFGANLPVKVRPN